VASIEMLPAKKHPDMPKPKTRKTSLTHANHCTISQHTV